MGTDTQFKNINLGIGVYDKKNIIFYNAVYVFRIWP